MKKNTATELKATSYSVTIYALAVVLGVLLSFAYVWAR